MTEYLAVSHFQVTVWAWTPALFYAAVFAAVHVHAKRIGPLGLGLLLAVLGSQWSRSRAAAPASGA